MATGKIQLINGNWYFFYAGRMMDLKCGPRTKPPVTKEQAESGMCGTDRDVQAGHGRVGRQEALAVRLSAVT